MQSLQSRLQDLVKEHPELKRPIASAIKKAATIRGHEVATNYAYYSWEYLQMNRTAILSEDNGNLYLTIKEDKSQDTFTGKRQTEHTMEQNVPVGTVSKPELRKVISLLKKHNFERSSATQPFKKKWYPVDSLGLGNTERNLSEIVKNYQGRMSLGPSVLTISQKKQEILKRVDSLSERDLDKILALL